MKRKWLITNVTAVGSTDKGECAIFGDDFGWALFWPIEDVFVVGDPLSDLGPPS